MAATKRRRPQRAVRSAKKASRAAPKRPRKAAQRKAPPRAKSPPAREAMLDLICGYWVSQLVFVAVRLKLADALADKPLTAAVIAGRVGANAAFLYRVLRALASVGVFAELPDRRFRLTPLAQTLRSDSAGSLRDFALHNIDDYMWQTWGALEHGVMTGANAFEHVYRKSPFQYLHERPEKERVFAAAMASISAGQNAAVAEAYPFGKLTRLVDVGGAHGHMLAEILRRHKKLTGVLFDQPQVVARAPDSGFITAPDIRGRCTIDGGNFFRSVPEGADGYVMKFIIHDWDDEECVRILDICRNAMAKGGRILIVENVIPKGNAKDWAKLLDINMMVAPGGKERSREEFDALMARAGLRLTRVYPTKAGISVVEAVAA